MAYGIPKKPITAEYATPEMSAYFQLLAVLIERHYDGELRIGPDEMRGAGALASYVDDDAVEIVFKVMRTAKEMNDFERQARGLDPENNGS